ncbi:MAG TPA: alpha/beta fold hydrolase [Usitatibacter sp.]|nr:alpha/beta fold hydrolase [Usitatibacter sp.]
MKIAALLAALLLASPLASGHAPKDPPHEKYCMGDLKLESGESIRDFCISYVTHGTLNADKSNAILMVTAIGGNHHRIDYLIGPGRALDPAKYFIVATDAISNGLTTSPSNSAAQPRMKFPRFNMRDMVASQHRLLTEKLGITRLVSVIGASMGGMQALQWGVSHPDMMATLVPIIPLGRTPPWTAGVLEMLRQSIMSDPDWKGGEYTTPPERGMRLWAGWLSGMIARNPHAHDTQFKDGKEVVKFLKGVQDGGWKRMEAVDWVYQSWAYDEHDVGATPGMGGDYAAALRSIKARTLVVAAVGDLLNPESDAMECAKRIPGAVYLSIAPSDPFGHASGGGARPKDNDFQNAEIGRFLEAAGGASRR